LLIEDMRAPVKKKFRQGTQIIAFGARTREKNDEKVSNKCYVTASPKNKDR